MYEYTDSDAHNLLMALAKYAEAFAKDHSDSELSVKALADDLADSIEDGHSASADSLRNRIYDGLNNNVGGDDAPTYDSEHVNRAALDAMSDAELRAVIDDGGPAAVIAYAGSVLQKRASS